MAEEYLDEIILEKKQEKKKERLLNYLQEHPIFPDELFQSLHIGEDIAVIKLPIGLRPMPKEMIEKKYQYDPQPQIVMTNRRSDVNFVFSVLEVTIPDSELDSSVMEIREGLRKFWPTAIFYETGQEEVNGIRIGWFSYMNNSLDGYKLYHMNYYAAMEKTIIMTMSCRYEQMEKWSAVAKFCVRSLTGKAYHG